MKKYIFGILLILFVIGYGYVLNSYLEKYTYGIIASCE